jgi:tetratricopeptide (TPR) repeat protein/DNA-binding winged helix-turn-helix (wHTH) protein
LKSELLNGFYLGDYFIEPLKGQVTGRNYSAHLTPRATEVLLVLACRPGRMVPREDILREVWGTDKGSSEALSHAIGDIRHALGDSVTNPSYVQTVPRRGYRLVVTPGPGNEPSSTVVAGQAREADHPYGLLQSLMQRGVVEAGLAYLILGWLLIQVADVVFEQLLLPRWAGTFVTVFVIAGFPIVLILSWIFEFRDGRATVDPGPSSRTPRQRFGRTYVLILCSLCVASGLVYIYDRFVGLPTEVAATPAPSSDDVDLPQIVPQSIAVLPFLNSDGSEQTEIFASGFAEDMINQLSLIPGLAVASRGDAWSLGPSASSSDVRSRLGVAQYVEGSVRLETDARDSSERISVNVKLIDSESGFPIISRNLQASLVDFNQVRREMTDVTIANLKATLPPDAQLMLDSVYGETDLDAYILYRRGKEIYEQPHSMESLREATRLYEESLAFDPGYAAAHAGLCSAYVDIYGYSGEAADIDRAQSACSAALQSNPRLHMVYSALGDLYLSTGRTAQAEHAYDEALAINPQDVRAMGGLADVYRREQRIDEAENLLVSATHAQPGNWRALNGLGTFYFTLGRFDEAAAEYRRVVNMNPENFQARSNLGSALTMAGEFVEGRRVFEEALELHPIQRTYSNLGVVYYFLGEFDKSVAMNRRAIELSPGLALSWLNLADSLQFDGQIEESKVAFEKARDLAGETLAVNPADTEALFALAWAQHMLGDSRQARASVERGLQLDPGDPYGYYYDALIHYRSGDTPAALEALGTALEKGYPAGMLVAEPYLGELRASPEFHALLRASF